MKVLIKLAACALAVSAIAACGEGRGPDGLTGEERERLNEHAERLDAGEADIVDASPDSLVANDEWIAAEAGEPAATDVNAGAAPAANAAANAQ